VQEFNSFAVQQKRCNRPCALGVDPSIFTPSDFADLTTDADYIQSPKLVKARYYRQLPRGIVATQYPKSAQFTS
jgi:hypothetical protein